MKTKKGKDEVELLKASRKQDNDDFKERYDREISKWIKAAHKVFKTEHYVPEQNFHFKKSG